MNTITQVQLWCHIPTKAGHIQTFRAADGYSMQLDRTSGILSIFKLGETQVIEVSPSTWLSITSEPFARTQSVTEPLPAVQEAPPETTKVWTKPKPSKKS